MLTKNIPAPFLGKIRVLPVVPESLCGLEDLAHNLWWAWNPSARALFRHICPTTWLATDGNPIRFMNAVPQAELDRAAKDGAVRALYDQVMGQFNDYLSTRDTWFLREFPEREERMQIAYFSAEYGLHESLPIYSGGLGVLAGDHCKSASDLGLPFVAVGMLYREGYFIQGIDSDGQQQAIFKAYNWNDLPIRPAQDQRGHDIKVAVELPGRTIHAKVWRVQVGRIPLYLLDTDIEENSAEDRKITARLYGGGQEVRIQQEILLGIGGRRALRALGHSPTTFHMNEGHSVFLGLERLRELITEKGLAFNEALETVRATTLFTTHTPVPAGNDAFPPPVIEKYFRPYWESIGISRARFMSLGLDTMPDGGQLFSLTVLALNLASMANGVSELHGHVSRDMWQHVWPDVPADESPIDHITNGIHTRTWLAIDMQHLFDRHLPKDWRERLPEPELWDALDKVPDEELWPVICKLREDMIDFVHRRVMQQHQRYGESPEQVRHSAEVLDPKVLTIGFARRFATYKRATLMFRDRERLLRILNHPERPVQFVFAGKAHPADQPGQALIRQIQEISSEAPFAGKIIFLENYDMNMGRRLVSGVDVWLNNPRRPYEASGTSGMKVPLNGGINCSILDGWWVEAFRMNPASGWALGEDSSYKSEELQDAADAESLYSVLESQVAPLFYDRDEKGIPREWLRKVRESMKTVIPHFSTNRMVQDYARKFYAVGSGRHELLVANRFERARAFAAWKEKIRAAWPNIRVHARLDGTEDNNASPVRVSQKLDVVAEVELGPINPDDVRVEIYVAEIEQDCREHNFTGSKIQMRPDGPPENGVHRYRGSLVEADSGEYGFTVRVVPTHPDLLHPHETGLMTWALREQY